MFQNQAIAIIENWPTQPLDRARFVFEQFGLPGRLD